ncbi:thiamine phosphate synthase [Aurantiacibacter sp. MUD11]|uniref:thiamine phosphate synthase n=1 Tax=Aurantiacibacter sp. MUD11 TaxID=3003265 RepID=UPI0022AAAD10|nr:thiamine phosphate synthase [Aurantiacibacter sp. MUD11]WAT16948.1 thiamine phosphate synthase [Aurantiacibacter sp. MUD11]
MPAFQPLPNLWLLSDERNDHVLEQRLRRFAEPVGFVFRHYHLSPAERVARYFALERIARAEGHLVVLSDSALTAREWGADGIYGAPLSLYPRRQNLLHVATAHDMREIAQANRIGADVVMLSPVFPTRSHPGGSTLGTARFRTLARHARMPVIALGGMTPRSARRLDWPAWAAIDGLS